MKCYPHQLAFAAAVSMAIFYSIGALLVFVFPDAILSLWSPLCYLTSTEFIRPFFGIEMTGFMSGIIQSFAYTYVYAWLLGILYNKLIPLE